MKGGIRVRFEPACYLERGQCISNSTRVRLTEHRDEATLGYLGRGLAVYKDTILMTSLGEAQGPNTVETRTDYNTQNVQIQNKKTQKQENRPRHSPCKYTQEDKQKKQEYRARPTYG